jgi:hypothetical protein
MGFKSISDEQYAKADEIVQGGASVADASRQTGISAQTLYKRYKPAGTDPTPGGRSKPRKANRPVATDDQLVSMMTKVAVAPAVPAALWLKCDFCAGHFVNTGPDAAAKLVELSHDSPGLRSLLDMMHRYAQEAAWAGILATWMGVPIAHHLAPDFIYNGLRWVITLPPRGVDATHTHAPPASNGSGPAPPVTPFAGMDLESLMAMAGKMGIQFDMAPVQPAEDIPDADEVIDDAAAETTDDADAPDAADAEEATSVTPDTDSGE